MTEEWIAPNQRRDRGMGSRGVRHAGGPVEAASSIVVVSNPGSMLVMPMLSIIDDDGGAWTAEGPPGCVLTSDLLSGSDGPHLEVE